jgi:hypothetical protein
MTRARAGQPEGVLARALSRHATGRLAKRVPALKFLAIGEVALLTGRHLGRLTGEERRRLATLVLDHARRRPLDDDERLELAALVRRLDARAYAGGVVDALSPVPLPRRLREGPRRAAA